MKKSILLSLSFWIKVFVIFAPIMILFETTSKQVALSYELYIILFITSFISAYIIEYATRLSKQTEQLQSFLEFQKKFIFKDNEDKDSHE